MRYKYSAKQEKELLKSIVILIDTREQQNAHIIQWLDAKCIRWKSKKLDFGDYSFYIPANEELDIPRDLMFTDEIVIERKASLDELVGNLSERRQIEVENPKYDPEKPISDDNPEYILQNVDEIQRFESELVRAQKSGAIFDLIIESSSWFDLCSGNYRSKYKEQSFMARLHAFMARYGISVNFVNEILMGQHIYFRFYYYARERFGEVLMDDLMEGREED